VRHCLFLLAALMMAGPTAAALMMAGPTAAGESTVNAGGFPATLSATDAHGPLVVMVAGSGPTDRDGNNPFGVRAGYLRKLASTLAERGFASLRYDKRGLLGSVPAGDEADVDFDTFVADLEAVVGWARGAYPDRGLILLGHSEGGMVAIEAARRAPDAYCGLVLLATPGRPPGDMLRDQLTGLPEPVADEAKVILAMLEAGRRVDAVPQALAGVFRASVQPFVISMLKLRPAAALGALDLPTLVIGGGMDLQVKRADFDALAVARPGIANRWYETMNHVLVDAPADFAGNVATYGDADAVLTDGLAEAVADFAKRVDRQ